MKITIDISDEIANYIQLMMKDYASKTGRPQPTLEAAVTTFFVVGLRESVRFGEPPPGYNYGEWVPKEELRG